MKFKVGDRVRIKKTSEICIVVSKNDIYEPEYETETVNLLNIETERYLGFFTEDDLELDDSLEQLAVEKFKEELREKINAKIMLLGMCSDVYVEEEAKNKVIKIKQLKEILKLLEK